VSPWLLIFFGGLLGSTHCLGMCGGLAAIIGLNTGSLAANVRAQLLYSVGRLTTYAGMGAVAGYAGRWLQAHVPGIVNVSAVLCAVAGLLLVREGLRATGLWQKPAVGTSRSACLLGPLFRGILRVPGARNAFAGGILTGLLPCGLVYAFVSLAATSGDLLQGIAIMTTFGAGTVPLMVFAGCGVSLLNLNTREWLWKAAGWSVVVTGLLTLGRGASFLQAATTETKQTPRCPLCAQAPETPEISPVPDHD